jgi:hypothetical protein
VRSKFWKPSFQNWKIKMKNYSPKFKIILIISILFLGIFGLAKISQAATYYVATTGSDSSSGTSAAPFKTIQKAADIVNPGDTVIVRDGVYTDTNGDGFVVILQRAGTPSNWITFKSQNKWGAKIDFTGAFRGFNLDTESAYVRFEDFEIYGGSVIANSCDAIAIGSNSETDYAHDLYLYRFKIHDVCRVVTGAFSGLSGIDVAGNANGNITIDSCIFYNIGRLNYYTNPQAVPGGTLAENEATCIDKDGYNACYNRDPGIYTRAGGLTIINNIFYPEFEAGWPIQLYAIRKQVKNTKIVNNTFYGFNPQRDYHIILAGGFGEDNILIQNNIFSNPRNYALTYSSSATNITNITVKNNIVYGASLMNSSACSDPDYTCSGNITGQDPKFVNSAGLNFHLQSASPAIDKGLAYSGRTADADGKSIVGAPDIGAYEYGGVPSDTTAPAAPQGLKVN